MTLYYADCRENWVNKQHGNLFDVKPKFPANNSFSTLVNDV